MLQFLKIIFLESAPAAVPSKAKTENLDDSKVNMPCKVYRIIIYAWAIEKERG